MTAPDPHAAFPAERPGDRRLVALAVLGAWTIVIPYLGPAVGLELHVASRVEIVDHVLPGALIMAIGIYLAASARRTGASGRSRLIGGSACFLAGFWVLATHAALVSEAISGTAPWAATLWHASTALPIAALSLWMVLEET